MKSKISGYLLSLENGWTEYPYVFCSLFGLITAISYYQGFIINLRSTIAHVVVFSAVILGILGVFLTLLITLRESIVFQRMRVFFPDVNEKLFRWIRDQLWSGISVVLLSVIISVLPTPSNKFLSSFGVFIWSTIFWHIGIGSFYTIKLITDLILRNDNSPPPTIKE